MLSAPTRSAPVTSPRPCPRVPRGRRRRRSSAVIAAGSAGCPGRRRRPGPAGRTARCFPPAAAASPARIPVAERWIMALTSADARSTWHARGRAGSGGAGRGSTPGTAPRSSRPARYAPASGCRAGAARRERTVTASRCGCRRQAPAGRDRPARPGRDAGRRIPGLAGRVRAAVHRRPEPDAARGRRLGRRRRPGSRPAQHPEEELLAGLGAAARLFRELDEALREPGARRDGRWTPTGAFTVPPAGRAAAGRRPGSACCCRPGRRKAGSGSSSPRGRRSRLVDGRGRGRVRPGRPGGLPHRPGDRRRDAERRGAGRAGPAQGPAGPGPRPVGGAGRPAAQGGAEVPRAAAGRAS